MEQRSVYARWPFFEYRGYATTQLSCTVVDEVVAPGLQGFLAMKISPGGILGARTASLRHGYAIDHQSELAILVPNASAEKRTSEQPTGKRTSVTPRDKRIVADTSGADAAKRAMTIPPKTEPTMNPTAMWAAAPPHGRWLTQPSASPRHPYSGPL